MHSSFESIKDVFVQHPGLSKIRKRVEEADIINEFPDIFPELSKLIVPVRVEKKVLFLRVENSVLKSELKFNELIMVEKINRYFKDNRIISIRFTS
jgi:hypothetical protein